MQTFMKYLGKIVASALMLWPLWVPMVAITANTFPTGLQLIVLLLGLIGAVANGIVWFTTTSLRSDNASPALIARAQELVDQAPNTYWWRALRMGAVWGGGTALMIFAVPDSGWLTGFAALFMFLSTVGGVGHCVTAAAISTEQHYAEEG
jgi:hypothetical protein